VKPTTVVSVRGKPPADILAAGVIYVGRPHYNRNVMQRRGGLIFPGHALANPFKLPRRPTPAAQLAAARRCVRLYAEWLLSDPGRVEAARRLRGCVLGCWCGEWTAAAPDDRVACHAVSIARLAEGLAPVPESWGES